MMTASLLSAKLIISCLIVTTVFEIGASGQVKLEDNSWMLWQNGVGARWLMYHLEKPDVQLLRAKWDKIGDASKEILSDVAGTYIVPDYMSGYFFRFSKENGYVFVRFFDVEHPCYFSFGDIRPTISGVEFIHKGESRTSACPPDGDGRPPHEWVFALNGAFLVPKDQIRDFADYYGGYAKYNGYHRQFENNTPFPIRWGSEVKEKPDVVLPPPFSKYVKNPLTGNISSVGKSRIRKVRIFKIGGDDYETITPVTINLTRRHGLKPKQEFILLTKDDVNSETLIVTSVGTRSSRGIVVRRVSRNGKQGFYEWNDALGDSEFKQFTKLTPGIKITTSPLSKY